MALESVYVSPDGDHDRADPGRLPAGRRGRGPGLPPRAGGARTGGRHGHPPAGARRAAHARRAARRCGPSGRAAPARWWSSWSTSATRATPARCCGPRTPRASTAVLFAGESVDPYNPKTVRASAGSLFHVPLAVRDDPPRWPPTSRRPASGPWPPSCGTARTTPTSTGPCRRRCSSATSPPGSTPRLCGELAGSLAIPMAGRAESLNVGVACAVVCFEAFRQRRGGGAGARAAIVPTGGTGSATMTDDVDLDVDGIAGDGERAIAARGTRRRCSAQVETEYLGKRSALTRAHRALGALEPRGAQGGRTAAPRGPRTRLEAQLADPPRPSWPTPSAARRCGPTASTSPR